MTQHLPKKITRERAPQSDKRLRKIAENIGEAFWLVDASTDRILYVNLDGILNYYATFAAWEAGTGACRTVQSISSKSRRAISTGGLENEGWRVRKFGRPIGSMW